VLKRLPKSVSAPKSAWTPTTIATFNINNINRHLPNLLRWLANTKPDVVCLQELKTADESFPAKALEEAGYHAVWQGQRTWNGVAILSRGTPPIVTRRALPGDPSDTQSRYIEAAVGGLLVGCIYLPNGNPQPGPKFDYKLAWFERLIKYAGMLYDSGMPVVLAGDYNVVPTDNDIYSTKSWKRDALLQPAPRAAYQRLLQQGWVDALRALYPTQKIFTFWDYFRNHWERDAGLRIDHILLNAAVAPRLAAVGVDREVRGEASPSDHAPLWIKLKKASAKTPGAKRRQGAKPSLNATPRQAKSKTKVRKRRA
jgi:exodeoxyribonuclease-3